MQACEYEVVAVDNVKKWGLDVCKDDETWDYCTEFLRERNIRYSKNKPNGVVEEIYLNKLIERTKETNHIKSFKNFIDFCYELRGEIQRT